MRALRRYGGIIVVLAMASRLTVSKETRVRMDCLVKIIDIVLPAKGLYELSPDLIVALTSDASLRTSLISSPDQSSM